MTLLLSVAIWRLVLISGRRNCVERCRNWWFGIGDGGVVAGLRGAKRGRVDSELITDTTYTDGTWTAGGVGLFRVSGYAVTREFDDVTVWIDSVDAPASRTGQALDAVALRQGQAVDNVAPCQGQAVDNVAPCQGQADDDDMPVGADDAQVSGYRNGGSILMMCGGDAGALGRRRPHSVRCGIRRQRLSAP